MDQKAVEKVCRQIYRQFPPLAQRSPKVSQQSESRYLLVFSGEGTTPDGKSIKQTVRVVATDDGRILKTSTSR
jgi:hypothetical protein